MPVRLPTPEILSTPWVLRAFLRGLGMIHTIRVVKTFAFDPSSVKDDNDHHGELAIKDVRASANMICCICPAVTASLNIVFTRARTDLPWLRCFNSENNGNGRRAYQDSVNWSRSFGPFSGLHSSQAALNAR